MEYSGINGKIRLEPDAVILERTGLGAKAAGLARAGRRIPLKEVSDAKLKPATRLVNGWLTIGVHGQDVLELGVGTAASDLNTVIFRHAHAAQFAALHEWLLGVAEANKESGLYPSAIELEAPGRPGPERLEERADRPAADEPAAEARGKWVEDASVRPARSVAESHSEPVLAHRDPAVDAISRELVTEGEEDPLTQERSASTPAGADKANPQVGAGTDSGEQAKSDWATVREVKMAHKLGTDRPDIVAAAARMGSRLGGNRELKKLIAHLHEGERVRLIVQGTYTGRQGILVMTDTRLLFLFHGFVSQAKEDLPLRLITSVQTSKSFGVGQLVVTVSGRTSTIDGVLGKDLDLLADALRIGMAPPISPPQPSVADHAKGPGARLDPYEALRQLASLRDSGVLTQEEFEAKKKQFLDRF